MKETRINEIRVVILVAVSLLIFVSLLTFNSNDLSLFSSNPNIPVNNFAGVIGAYLAGILVFFTGKASFIIPLLGVLWAIARILGRPPQKSYIKFIGTIVLILATSSLFSAMTKGEEAIKFARGGLLGLGFSGFLGRYFGSWGTYIILIALFLLSLILATDFLIFPFLQKLFKNSSKNLSGFKKIPQTFIATLKSINPKLKKIEKPARKAPFEVVRQPDIRALKPMKSKSIPKPIVSKVEPKKIDETPKPAFVQAQELEEYKLPSLNLLDSPPPVSDRLIQDDLTVNSKILEETLGDFGLEVKVVKTDRGPVITRYELEPAPGIKINRISSLSDNIALAMKSISVRVVAPLPGKGTVGVEVPNSQSTFVYLKDILESSQFQNVDSALAIALGKNIAGEPVVTDLADMPHLLIAGATGSGKTVCVNSLIASLLFKYSPDELKFIMVDPKMVELATFNGLPHLLCPVVTDVKKVAGALNWVVNEMDSRYKLLAGSASRNIDIYNAKIGEGSQERLPYIILIIDELADLMQVAQGDVENAITRLAQLSRAVGIHIVLATQRPSVDVITGVIKANFPARISFKVASKVDSRTVLDMNGADKLLGKGDMLFIEPGVSKPIRAQGCLVADGEILKIVDYIKSQRTPQYNDSIVVEQKKLGFKKFERDEVYEEAVKLILQSRQASVSMLQRRLGLGYTRAARIIDMMEDEGIVGPYMGSKPREILVEDLESVRKDDE